MLRAVIGIVFVVVAWAYVSNQDYQIKAATACENKGGNWDGNSCVKTFRVERKCK